MLGINEVNNNRIKSISVNLKIDFKFPAFLYTNNKKKGKLSSIVPQRLMTKYVKQGFLSH